MRNVLGLETPTLPDRTSRKKTAEETSVLFDNKPNYISPDQVIQFYPIAVKTVYDWHYRPNKYSVPNDLFQKFGRKLMLRRDVLEKWVNSRNAQ